MKQNRPLLLSHWKNEIDKHLTEMDAKLDECVRELRAAYLSEPDDEQETKLDEIVEKIKNVVDEKSAEANFYMRAMRVTQELVGSSQDS